MEGTKRKNIRLVFRKEADAQEFINSYKDLFITNKKYGVSYWIHKPAEELYHLDDRKFFSTEVVINSIIESVWNDIIIKSNLVCMDLMKATDTGGGIIKNFYCLKPDQIQYYRR